MKSDLRHANDKGLSKWPIHMALWLDPFQVSLKIGDMKYE
jgi:hypothetical protein